MNGELEFKPDFAAAQAAWDAFWQGDNRRPMVLATLPKTGCKPVSKPAYGAGFDGNFEPVIDQLLGWAETHDFVGDTIPFFYLEYAPAQFAAFLGADLRFPEDGHGSGWAVPFVQDWDAVELKFRPESKWWEHTARFAAALRRRCEGRLLIAAPTLVANLDALEAVRGPQSLMMDLVDRPAAVHRALEQVTRAHQEILRALAELLGYQTWGSITRHGLYSLGRIGVPQCDASCMISAEMFREFVVPYLTREIAHYDATEYHLDGPDAIKHLESVCAIDRVGVIQWVPGAGEAAEQDWTELRRRIDALGKGQFLAGQAVDIKRQWREYRSKRLIFRMNAKSRDEVDQCIRELETMGK